MTELTLRMLPNQAPSWNVVSRIEIKDGDFIGYFTGQVKAGVPDDSQPFALEAKLPGKQMNEKIYVDAKEKGNFLKFLMHQPSGANTLYTTVFMSGKPTWRIVAAKNIKEGEALTITFPQLAPR